MWLSLWPLTLRGAICNPNKRRHPADFVALHNTPLRTKEGRLSTPLKAPCYLGGHMFPIENSLLPSKPISVSLWFKPETKEALILSCAFPFQKLPSWNDLHQQELLRFFFFFPFPYIHCFPKGVLKVILHFIITNGAQRMTCGMVQDWQWEEACSPYRADWVYIFIPTCSKPGCF